MRKKLFILLGLVVAISGCSSDDKTVKAPISTEEDMKKAEQETKEQYGVDDKKGVEDNNQNQEPEDDQMESSEAQGPEVAEGEKPDGNEALEKALGKAKDKSDGLSEAVDKAKDGDYSGSEDIDMSWADVEDEEQADSNMPGQDNQSSLSEDGLTVDETPAMDEMASKFEDLEKELEAKREELTNKIDEIEKKNEAIDDLDKIGNSKDDSLHNLLNTHLGAIAEIQMKEEGVYEFKPKGPLVGAISDVQGLEPETARISDYATYIETIARISEANYNSTNKDNTMLILDPFNQGQYAAQIKNGKVEDSYGIVK